MKEPLAAGIEHGLDLPLDAVRLHNGTARGGHDREFTTDQTQWGYAVSFPIVIPPPPDTRRQPVIIVEVDVLSGSVGVGIVDTAMRNFVTSEIDVAATGGRARITLHPDRDLAAHIMVRNIASGGLRSRFRVIGATLQFAAVDRRRLVPIACPEIHPEVHQAPSLTGVFDVLISHSSRNWDPTECDRDHLRDRFAKPDRLRNLPSFESLPPDTSPYHGLLSLLRIRLSPSAVTSEVLQHLESRDKVMHSAVAGNRVFVCFEKGLTMFRRREGAPSVEVVPESAEHFSDPWFGGLHTVVPVDERTCLVSSAAADAILWLDVPRGKVVRRWRLPADRYGTNYTLDETTWLNEHYVPNDFQLGHLNCAAPDGRGGAYFSVLGQGDVGHVDGSGSSDVLVSGYVGCHGVRYEADRDWVYFSDSCSGRLMRVAGRGNATVLFAADSRWLHDAVHLAGGLFLLTLGDLNRLVLADVERGCLVAEWDFSEVRGTVQFLSVASDHRPDPIAVLKTPPGASAVQS